MSMPTASPGRSVVRVFWRATICTPAFAPSPRLVWISVSAPSDSTSSTLPLIVPSPAFRSSTFSGRTPMKPSGAFRAPTALRRPGMSATSITFICGMPMNCATKRLAGRSYRSSGEPTCSIEPSRSTTTRSASVIASTWSCVT